MNNKALFTFLTLFMTVCAFAQTNFNEKTSSAEKDFFNQIQKEALESIPSEIQNYKISIRFRDDLNNTSSNYCEPEKNEIYAVASVLGKKKVITLSLKLLKNAVSNKTIYPCKHGTFKKLLKATLIHEYIHFYDSKYKFTETKRFRSLVGGRTFYAQKGRLLQNNHVGASVDTYEYKNFKESFAVNFEYFILDKSFKCKKPAYYKFYKEKLNLDPSFDQECEGYDYVLINQNDLDANLTSKVRLDRKRLYQVHYLFAGKGQGIMSTWGHSMYRLVMCAPHRKQVGPECLNDISHHLVLSYRANVSELAINSIAGLVGNYPSQIFIYQLADIIQEYTKGELRDLWSVPLNLEENELTNFLDLTIQRFWDYSGKYYFTSNNCATESKKHLVAAVNEDRPRVGAFNPLRMYKQFLETEKAYVDTEIYNLEDKQNLIRKGYLFQSEEPKLKESIGRANDHGLELPLKLKKLHKTQLQDRFNLYQDYVASQSFKELSNDQKFIILVDLMKIEKHLSIVLQIEVSAQVIAMAQTDKNTKQILIDLTSNNPYFFVTQWTIVENESFGIPNKSDVSNGLNKVNKIRKNNNGLQKLVSLFKTNPTFVEIEKKLILVEEVKNFLKSSLRSIN